jgi:predicted ABC-type sugar transport system permease subunit
MFAQIALGMSFVIITGGIDLSVGGVAAIASVGAAYLSPYGWFPGLAGGMIAGLVAGSINGLIVPGCASSPHRNAGDGAGGLLAIRYPRRLPSGRRGAAG